MDQFSVEEEGKGRRRRSSDGLEDRLEHCTCHIYVDFTLQEYIFFQAASHTQKAVVLYLVFNALYLYFHSHVRVPSLNVCKGMLGEWMR